MPAYVSMIVYLMALGTAALDVAVILFAFASLKSSLRALLAAQVRANAYVLIILLSVGCVAGTLFLEYAGALVPCILCWWQRVFMYPIAIIALIAFFKNERFSAIADYVLAFSFLGALVALYQHLLQVLPQGTLVPCDPSNDCAVRTIFEFNFITLPWMAFTAFVVIFLIALVARTQAAVPENQIQ